MRDPETKKVFGFLDGNLFLDPENINCAVYRLLPQKIGTTIKEKRYLGAIMAMAGLFNNLKLIAIFRTNPDFPLFVEIKAESLRDIIFILRFLVFK